MAHYPIGMDLSNRRCVVVGGGKVAQRKVETLREFGARVVVVSPEVTSRLREMAEDGSMELVTAEYEPRVLDGAFLVIAATDDREVNEAVSAEAQRRGILVNVVDDPELCTFFVPATVRRGDLLISVSTSGKSPYYARWIREHIQEHIGPECGELAEILGDLRDEVKSIYTSPEERIRAYERVVKSDVLELLRQGRREEAYARARECISQS